jgi:hypothetical protein
LFYGRTREVVVITKVVSQLLSIYSSYRLLFGYQSTLHCHHVPKEITLLGQELVFFKVFVAVDFQDAKILSQFFAAGVVGGAFVIIIIRDQLGVRARLKKILAVNFVGANDILP